VAWTASLTSPLGEPPPDRLRHIRVGLDLDRLAGYGDTATSSGIGKQADVRSTLRDRPARSCPRGTPFNKKEIDDALAKQGIQIKKGDVVLFHTGWQDLADKDTKAFMGGEPGLGKEGAEYLVSKEVVAIGADTWGLEVVPFEKGVGVFEVHQILLPRNGVYILENMNTAPLVADRAWEFMFVLGHSRITGAVQAIINPVAIR
jgi:kynurenine formamidase